ncbi:MAG: hypothetical protein OXQ92_04270 [Boseongicola sp.]|nr:hypothetical protein [Boseongicola sp.]
MTETRDDRVLVTVQPSVFRRWVAILIFIALGAVLIWVAAKSANSIVLQVAFLGFGLLSVLAADKIRRATDDGIELTRKGLRTISGTHLARVENVEKVDRGAFAFKPSNGFVVKLKEAEDPRGWAPGLWWRGGKLLGVGGVVSAGETKAMAELLTAIIMDVLPEDFDDEK